MTGPLVTVLGEAVVHADPELAVFTVVLTAEERDRAHVLSRIGDLHKRSWHNLVALGNGVNVETGSVSVHPRYSDPISLRRPPWFVASAELRVEVADFPLLPDVLAVLGVMDGGSFSGPYWQLRPDSDVHRRARRAAVQDALRRAEEHATALGCTLTELLELSDPVDGPGGPPYARGQDEALSAASAGGGGLAELDLRPVRQQVHGSVRARFRMTVPDLDTLLEALPPVL